MTFGPRSAPKLNLNREQFTAVERLAVYEVVNATLLAHIEMQRRFGMRAEEFQVFILVAVSSVQRYVRGATAGDPFLDRTPIPFESNGFISRRRIAETLGIPLETVRRHIVRLIALGLVGERERGRLSTTGGTLDRGSKGGLTQQLLQQHLAVTNSLARLGVYTASTSGKCQSDSTKNSHERT
jgi:hypothetical protein